MLKKILAALAASAFFAVPAQAQWAVFDAGNFVKNTISSGQLVIAEAQRANQILTQQMQLARQLEHLKNLGEAIPKYQVDDVTQNIAQLRVFTGQAAQLYGDIEKSRSMMEGHMRQWSMSGLSWQGYVDATNAANAARGEALNFLRYEEAQQIDRMARQADSIQRTAAAIGGISGSRDGLQLLNTQLNVLLGQSADMLRLATTSRQVETQAQAKKLAEEQREQAIAAQQKKNAASRSQAVREDLEKLKGFNPFSALQRK